MSQCLGVTRSNLANLVPSALFWGWDVARLRALGVLYMVPLQKHPFAKKEMKKKNKNAFGCHYCADYLYL